MYCSQVLPLYLPGGTKEIEMQSQAVQLVFHPRFQPSVFHIPNGYAVLSTTATQLLFGYFRSVNPLILLCCRVRLLN